MVMSSDINIFNYLCTMSILKKWYEDALISDDDYIKMEKTAADKFGIKISDIYRTKDLIKPPSRVINIHDKRRS